MRKVLIIGLDAVPLELIQEFSNDLPNIIALMDKSIYGKLESCHPPITIPAWAVMVTGKDPGTLGIYGFRHRKKGSYTEMWIANSHSIKERALWNFPAMQEKKVCLAGVPPAYPPLRVNGLMISCFITPDKTKEWTYPQSLKMEVEKIAPDYIFDVEFRTDEKEKLVSQIYQMTEQRFRIVKYLMEHKPWDLFMFVEMGPDRIHHGFWKFFDKEHHHYQSGNRYENVIRDYYRYLDKKIGELIQLVGKDTVVIIVSDHGTKRMKGAFCINEWLVEKGYLKLRKSPSRIVTIEQAEIDWGKTIAWGWGGYHARIFLNVEGREPEGKVKKEDYGCIRDEIAGELMKIEDVDGRKMETKVFYPEELYSSCKGNPPDLMVYFDDLYWRSAGTLGHPSMYLPENDTGPDDAVHSQHGIFIIYDPGNGRKRMDANIVDIAPTVLYHMESKEMEGKIIDG
jgi:predicted AlkP superfamily phosphohydrolase/phosphomutase